MVRWREGVVAAVLSARGTTARGAACLDLEVDVAAEGRVRALAYPALVGAPRVGDRVLLTVDALHLGLGTGGRALVAAVPDRLPADVPPTGHLVKGRYLPLQAAVAGVDEQGTPGHDVLAHADDLAGLPVVLADLHSALPAVVAGVRSVDPALRVAYVMTDGGALPAWFSRTAAALRDAAWLVTVVTCGQAVGGDHEAVTVQSALLAARLVAAADVAVVAQGPGNLGTGTRFGFSGTALAEALHATAALRGRPVAALRVSGSDARERHAGVSHHSTTVLGRLALARADVVVPRLPGPLGARVAAQAAPLAARHRLVEVDVDGLDRALATSPVPLSTMGRGVEEDAAPFLAAAAAGAHAGRLARTS